MQVIIISSNSKSNKHWHLTRSKLVLLMALLISLISVSSFSFANWINQSESFSTPIVPVPTLSSDADRQPLESVVTFSEHDEVHGFYAKQLGGLQAETIRLKMLSQRLAEIAGFDASEYFLNDDPAQGGISRLGLTLSGDAFDQGIEQLSLELESQENTLSALEQFLITKDTMTAGMPEGKPVEDGWVSSFYGYRIDPFNGKKTFHRGLDIAGKTGTSVVAVADGIVSWIGEKGGYGGLVEVDHGNGYVTRYAHNKTIKVAVGDRIAKGQQLALMGSTGRSTGPHVHFEVLRDGKHINPYNFIK